MNPTANYPTRRLLVDMAEERLRHWIGEEATRTQARAALDSAKFRTALSDEIRDEVLARFDPDPDPVEGKDYLPQLELYPDECPTCGPGCSCDIARPVVMWQRETPDVRPAASTGPVMHADVPVREWGELP